MLLGKTADFIVTDDPQVHPLDAVPQRLHPEAERLFAIGGPSLKSLSYVLRHPELWPNGFVWYYGHCDTCALGLAQQLWDSFPRLPSSEASSRLVAPVFQIHEGIAQRIFLGQSLDGEPARWLPRDGLEAVTPSMVADQIDKYLATVK